VVPGQLCTFVAPSLWRIPWPSSSPHPGVG
jgi:hypothetical protein